MDQELLVCEPCDAIMGDGAEAEPCSTLPLVSLSPMLPTVAIEKSDR